MDWGPLYLSLEAALMATVLAGLAGIAIGALLANPRTPGRHFFDAIVAAPMVMPPTVLGYYVLVAVGRKSALGGLYRDVVGSDLTFTFHGVVLAAAIGALPMVAKAARTAFEGVDRKLLAAARTLGAGRVRAFFTIAVPLAAPGLVGGLMLGFARGLGDFGVTLMVAGDIPGETQSAPLAIYDHVQAGREHSALLMSLVLTLSAVAILFAVNVLTARHTRSDER
ncbi:MAG: molybdate ABC transporter permease subunit [Kofleriaceae bacterium]|nr:molybdate ABC transporter permease subunit [Kofleriaceae bacterium]MBP9171109.1 molybdate ABC transporter permease subunit [Kofleriaceae bacterium]MBP9860887.1 molybdate ABC transporter permease subunit [Kofleriaceae bacterium]